MPQEWTQPSEWQGRLPDAYQPPWPGADTELIRRDWIESAEQRAWLPQNERLARPLPRWQSTRLVRLAVACLALAAVVVSLGIVAVSIRLVVMILWAR